MRRRISVEDGRAAVETVTASLATNPHDLVSRATMATAVRFLLEELGSRHPGRTLEVRVPPHGAVQCIEGPTHTRGTPPNVIETDAVTWVQLATGSLDWETALATHRVTASGMRATLAGVTPLYNP